MKRAGTEREMMRVEPAVMADMPEIRRIFQHARAFMQQNGNPSQWGSNRPDEHVILADIEEGRFYTVRDEEGIYGVFAFLPGPDPTYGYIFDGAWLNDEPYRVIHRVASSGEKKGIMDVILAFCEAKADQLRIDTHENNRVMRHVLEKHGFTCCGKIYTDNGTVRLAYQKVVDPMPADGN